MHESDRTRGSGHVALAGEAGAGEGCPGLWVEIVDVDFGFCDLRHVCRHPWRSAHRRQYVIQLDSGEE